MSALVRHTIFSADRAYRYALWREWDLFDPRYVMFVGLNPSTATETIDDPTVRRMIRYAKDWGYGALCVGNAFAFRATDPAVMKAQENPVGPENDYWLRMHAMEADMVIAGWGARGGFRNRQAQILQVLADIPLYCLGTTKEHYPRHPLYLPKMCTPVPWKECA